MSLKCESELEIFHSLSLFSFTPPTHHPVTPCNPGLPSTCDLLLQLPDVDLVCLFSISLKIHFTIIQEYEMGSTYWVQMCVTSRRGHQLPWSSSYRQAPVSYRMWAWGNWTLGLWKSSMCASQWSHLCSPWFSVSDGEGPCLYPCWCSQGQRLTMSIVFKELSKRKIKMEVYRGNVAKANKGI